jgi:AraC-like DNA-binding protein
MSDSAYVRQNRIRDVIDHMHIRLFTVEAVTISAGHWNTQNVQSPFWRFYRNPEEGASLRLANGERFPLAAERVYFVPAGVRFSCRNEAAFRHFYIHFDLVGLPSLTMRTLFDGPVALPPCAIFEQTIEQFVEQTATGSRLDIAGQCRAKALIYEGLARYLEALPLEIQERGVQQAEALEPVAPAIRYIDTHLAARLVLPELAALCCLGPDHFARRFKECVGQTVGAYIRERRIMQAAQRLRFTMDSLETIAAECGFGNRNYLTRLFTQEMGIAPAAYRKSGEYTS